MSVGGTGAVPDDEVHTGTRADERQGNTQHAPSREFKEFPVGLGVYPLVAVLPPE